MGVYSSTVTALKEHLSPDDNHVEAVDAATYREIMREVASPVSIVASGVPGKRNGLTATAVCSVSDAPPTLLVCVKQNTSAHDDLLKSEFFSINFLTPDQQAEAEQFAGQNGAQGEDRFSIGNWKSGEFGAPILANSLCSLECQLVSHQAVATHTLFFGTLVSGSKNDAAAALLYQRGLFRDLPPEMPPSEPGSKQD